MTWKYPIPFGSLDRARDIEHEALLDALSPGWDIDSSTEVWAETRIDALAVTMIWRINQRVANQMNPLKMQDALPDWEQACGLTTGECTPNQRRAALAAKLRGLAGNSLIDITEAASLLLGNNYDAVLQVDPDSEVNYWPGINPGPPGYEFASNRATIGIRMNRSLLSESDFVLLRSRLVVSIDQLRPAWLTFIVGVGAGFIVNQGVIGQTVLT